MHIARWLAECDAVEEHDYLGGAAAIEPTRSALDRAATGRVSAGRADRSWRDGQRVAGRTHRRPVRGPGGGEAAERRAGRPRRRGALAREGDPRPPDASADRPPRRRRRVADRPALSVLEHVEASRPISYCDAGGSTSTRPRAAVPRRPGGGGARPRQPGRAPRLKPSTCWSPPTAKSSCWISASPGCSTPSGVHAVTPLTPTVKRVLTPAYSAPEQVSKWRRCRPPRTSTPLACCSTCCSPGVIPPSPARQPGRAAARHRRHQPAAPVRPCRRRRCASDAAHQRRSPRRAARGRTGCGERCAATSIPSSPRR